MEGRLWHTSGADPASAIHERGFFGNQNSVTRPRSPKWVHTVERLKSHDLESTEHLHGWTRGLPKQLAQGSGLLRKVD
jgi:hypothetical protein